MREVRTQEEREKEVRAQEERERQARKGKTQGERREEEGKVEAQEGHEGEEEMTTQEECVEAQKEANSTHEENDLPNRHMTWWRKAWWIRIDDGSSRAQRLRKAQNLASRQESSRAGSRR